MGRPQWSATQLTSSRVTPAGPAAAGSITLKDGGASGTTKVVLDKAAQIDSGTVNFPGPILFKTDVYASFVTESVTAITVFHSGGSNT